MNALVILLYTLAHSHIAHVRRLCRKQVERNLITKVIEEEDEDEEEEEVLNNLMLENMVYTRVCAQLKLNSTLSLIIHNVCLAGGLVKETLGGKRSHHITPHLPYTHEYTTISLA